MTESWSQLGAAVRIAQAIGLHRDGADMVCRAFDTSHSISHEFQCRVWSPFRWKGGVECGKLSRMFVSMMSILLIYW